MPVTFTDGSEIMNTQPSAAFDRIIQQRYRLSYHLEKVGVFRDLEIKAYHGEDLIGHADFTDDDSDAHCQNVEVTQNHKRRGVATAMYVFAEKVFGHPLTPFWDGDEGTTTGNSAEAKALWSQSNRPFGRQ